MGLRVRRSVRLFPGVRLNFSRSGVSTTVGRRGATMTIGPQGTHVNVGLPGTGISYRTRVSPPSGQRPPALAPAPTPSLPPAPRDGGAVLVDPSERQIQSAPVGGLTSPGLGELKTLINEAAARRASLTRDVSMQKGALAKAQRRLDFAQGFISRLAFGKTAPQRAREVQAAQTRLNATEDELEGCHVEIDFGFDGQTHATYMALKAAFEQLLACERIWDITATSQVDRFAERSFASTAVRRTRVAFGVIQSDIVRTAEPVLRLGNAGNRDLQIYPGFLMMRDPNRDFALIEYRELDVRVADTRFVEEEQVPGDTKVIGQTWKKANKDGSRDLRFKENYSIPIVLYGEISLRSDAGVLEAYQFSDSTKARTFLQAYDAHRRALAQLVSRGGPAPLDVEESQAAPDEALEEAAAMARVKPLANLWLDWSALAAMAAAIVVGGIWARGQMVAAPAPPPPTVIAPTAAAPTHPVHHRRRHHRLAAPAGPADAAVPAPDPT